MITLDQLEAWEKEIKFLKGQYPPPETPLSLLQHFAECIAEVKRMRENESARLDIMQHQGFTYSTTFITRQPNYAACPHYSYT